MVSVGVNGVCVCAGDWNAVMLVTMAISMLMRSLGRVYGTNPSLCRIPVVLMQQHTCSLKAIVKWLVMSVWVVRRARSLQWKLYVAIETVSGKLFQYLGV